eukprot:218471-Chlamydomonas_euryale.AAC.2
MDTRLEAAGHTVAHRWQRCGGHSPVDGLRTSGRGRQSPHPSDRQLALRPALRWRRRPVQRSAVLTQPHVRARGAAAHAAAAWGPVQPPCRHAPHASWTMRMRPAL